MAFNGSGVFVRLYNWVNDAAAAIKIRADRMDAEMNGFATGLSNCITRDGQSPATANLPMGGFRHTNVANGVNRTDYATLGQIQDGSGAFVSTVGGTSTAITLTPSPAITVYTIGQTFTFRAISAATGATTVNISGIGVKTLLDESGNPIAINDWISGAVVTIIYDGTQFLLKSRNGGSVLATNTNISVATGDALSIINTGTGNSFIVNDAASDASPFVIDGDGNVAVGQTTSPIKFIINDGGTVAPYASGADKFAVVSSGNCAIQVTGGNTSQSAVLFSDPDARDSGGIQYLHSSDSMIFRVAGANRATINSTGVASFTGGVDANNSLITNVANAVAATNALNLQTGDGRYYQLTSTQQPASKNNLINGAFYVWQRLTSVAISTPTPIYTADRWKCGQISGTVSVTVQRIASPAVGVPASIRVQRNSGNTNLAALTMGQTIRSVDVARLQGQTVTLSYFAKCGANYSAASSLLQSQIITGTGVDEGSNGAANGSWTGWATQNTAATLTTTRQRFTATVTIPSTANELAVYFVETPVGTAGVNDWYEIDSVQLEVGSVATPFEYRGFSTELDLCNVYYAKTFPYATAPVQNSGVTASCIAVTGQVANQRCSATWNFPTRMRIAPTITTFSPNAASSNWGTNVVTPTSVVSNATEMGVVIAATTAVNAGADFVIHATADAEL